ncbi:MAG: response regulator transcription factor [Phycisphaerales bacterium]|nr:response regulator transcription factor [Phycisphaerales bacterium]
MSARIIRVLCVDDHAFLAEGLKARLELEPDLQFAGRLSSADGLVQQVKQLKPDIVLLDIEMPGADPFEAADDIRRQCPDTRVVFLSAFIRDHYINSAFKAGAWGYFSKSDDPDALAEGIRRAAHGEFAFGPKVAERCKPIAPRRSDPARAPSARSETLTERELEVLRLIGRGLSRAEIAKTLCRSAKTIDGHRERIMNKLGIHTGPELVRYAIREGYVEA